MKRKRIWMLCLIAALLGSLLLIDRTDAMELNGLYVMSEEELTKMVAELPRVDRPAGLDSILRFEGKAIPYDRTNNTFYVSQRTQGKSYEGIFDTVGEECIVYLQDEEILRNKRRAIGEGHVFRLWFVTKEAYAVCGLIFTGLPVIGIQAGEDGLSALYSRGSIVVQDPDDRDVVTMSAKESSAEAKVNEHTGTISFRLYKKNYREERNLSLLGLGKRTAWKLYPVSEKDEAVSREMVAVYLWNCICEEDALKKGMEYAEVVVNGEYRGLYYLAPKIGRGYLNLQEEDCLYACEAQQEDGAKGYKIIGGRESQKERDLLKAYEEIWEQESLDLTPVDIDNYMNYYLYVQTACAVQNGREEYYVAARGTEGSYKFSKIPGRSKFVFGMYPSEIGWQSLFASETILEEAEYDLLASRLPGLAHQTAERFAKLRENALSTENLVRTAYLYEQRLADSGYITRRGEINTYLKACDDLHEMIEARMEYLDRYYAGADEGKDLD